MRLRECTCRLRQVDVKAEHFERHTQRLEQERDEWEKKYEVRIERVRLDRLVTLNRFPFYRKQRPSSVHPKQSSTSSSRTWKASNLFASSLLASYYYPTSHSFHLSPLGSDLEDKVVPAYCTVHSFQQSNSTRTIDLYQLRSPAASCVHRRSLQSRRQGQCAGVLVGNAACASLA